MEDDASKDDVYDTSPMVKMLDDNPSPLHNVGLLDWSRFFTYMRTGARMMRTNWMMYMPRFATSEADAALAA